MQELGYRYYSPKLGRWVSRDPLADEAVYEQWKSVAGLCGAGCAQPSEVADVCTSPVYLFVDNSPTLLADYVGLYVIQETGDHACTKSEPTAISEAFEALEGGLSLKVGREDFRCCVADAYDAVGRSVPQDWDRNHIGQTLSKFRQASSPGNQSYVQKVKCPPHGNIIKTGWGEVGCDGKTGGYRNPKVPKVINVCPLMFSTPSKFGGLDCVLFHEMLHAILNMPGKTTAEEAMIVDITKCYKKGCEG